jgi:hypothetical protein
LFTLVIQNTVMNKIKFVKELNEKVLKRDLKKINERHSSNIGITEGNRTIKCWVLVDLYTDLEGNNLYKVEQHIDKESDYHTIDIEDYINGLFH